MYDNNISLQIKLVRPSIELKEEALAYRQEHFEEGEDIIYGSELFDKTESYEEWLKSVTDNTKKETVNPQWVVTDTFFAMDACNHIVGIIDFRHELKGFLLDMGNCGYSVRPSFRRKGIASSMLRQLIEYVNTLGFHQLQISVEKSNIASIKTIKKNGGVYERSFPYEGEEADIYMIRWNKNN